MKSTIHGLIRSLALVLNHRTLGNDDSTPWPDECDISTLERRQSLEKERYISLVLF
jgi:hypothetical protein